MDGAALYASNCASCHGADPKANQLKVMNATSVAALDSAIARVRAMSGLTGLTPEQKAAIVSFITR
jgi:mono/diheme cytochrome c family protein